MSRRDISFEILGTLRVRNGNRILAVSRPAVASLLGALLLTPRQPVSSGHLIALVWGPAGCRPGTLHTTVSRLRRWLNEQTGLENAVTSTGAGYLMDVPADSVDAARFDALAESAFRETDPHTRLEALRSALNLWHGPVMGDGNGSLHGDPAVGRLEKARVDCSRELTRLALELGRPGTALTVLQDISTDLPYDETIVADLVALLGASGRRAEALRLFESVRIRLADELGIDPSPALRDAHLDLLRGSSPTPHRAPSGRRSAPPTRTVCQLPNDIRDFTGRDAELDGLRRELRPGEGTAPAIWTIVGAGGMGKSALAVHAAHQLREVFPDGQLYARLGGPGEGPADPGDVLTRFLRALQVDEAAIPRKPAERAEMYRAQVADRRVLVVLDDAVDDAQVAPLLPGAPTCGVMITSRVGPLGPAGARSLALRTFDDAPARELLAKIIGPERATGDPRAAGELVRLCGRLPLALRIVGARLAARPHWSVLHLVERLRDPHHRLDELSHGLMSVRVNIGRSYLGLTELSARLFRRLGWLFESRFQGSVAPAVLEVGARAAEDALEELVDAFLLHPVTGPRNAYRFDELTRLFAYERAEAEEPRPHMLAARARLHTERLLVS